MQKIWSSFVSLMYEVSKALDLTSPIRYVILVADILIVTFIGYYIFKIVKQTRAGQIFKGILLVLLLPLSGWLFVIGVTIVIVGLMWLSCK